MSDFYYQVDIPISSIDPDILSDLIFSNAGLGIETLKESYICSFSEGFNKNKLQQELSKYMDFGFVEILKKKSENWMESWKENFKPIEVGNRFLIKPTWIESKNLDRIVIDIDPKMAFGTGTHETTQLILEQLPVYLRKGNSVLDAGTGSGILAIAAEKLGAKDVTAFDNDPVAIENCLENIALNNCRQTIAIIATIDQISGKFDLVTANINRNILIEIVQELIQRIKEAGFLILSGLLLEDKEVIMNYYKSLKFIKSIDKGEWTCLVFKK